MRSTPTTTLIALLMAPILFVPTSGCSEHARIDVQETAPPGVEQLLPRGAIPAIFEPEFVSALEAEIPDEAWILGVEIDGEARAYSLNLLNAHEVVNDRIGEKNFAAVW